VFLPLSERLLFFENGDYNTPHGEFMGTGDTIDFDYINLINVLFLSVQAFEDEDVYSTVNKYQMRVENLLKKIEPKSKYLDLKDGETKNVSKKKQKELMDLWHAELTTYSKYFKIIIQNINYNFGESKLTKIEKRLIDRLYTIQPQEIYNPVFSNIQVALFLDYLTQIKLIPKYPKEIQAIFGKLLFARNAGNIKTELTSNLQDNKCNNKELESLQLKIETLLSVIKKDLKS